MDDFRNILSKSRSGDIRSKVMSKADKTLKKISYRGIFSDNDHQKIVFSKLLKASNNTILYAELLSKYNNIFVQVVHFTNGNFG